MEKVKVNRKIFEALKKWEHDSNKPLELGLVQKIKNQGFTIDKYKSLNDLNIKDFCECLLNGYELEESPEEELARYYNMKNKNVMDDVFNSGIKCALNVLGIEIKGINS